MGAACFGGSTCGCRLRRGDPPQIPSSLRQGCSRKRRDQSSRPWRRSCALSHITRHARW
jgi:hypothetical protein